MTTSVNDTSANDIAGYDYGRAPRSPVSMDDLARLEASAGFGADDRLALLRLGELIVPRAEALVDRWRKIIGAQPHLARWFEHADGSADDTYKAKVKPRFVKWVVDTCTRPFDQAWLDYQQEIGLRHTPAKKNITDGAATQPLVPLRYLLAFAPAVTLAVRDELTSLNVKVDEIDTMHAAWVKAVMLTLTLWSLSYTREGLW